MPSQPPPAETLNAFTYLLYTTFPVAVPVTIKEEKSSAVEFRVTVPLLVKSSETVKEEVSSIVKVFPSAIVTDLAVASVLLAIAGSLAKEPLTTTSSLIVGTAPVLQFDVLTQEESATPVQE